MSTAITHHNVLEGYSNEVNAALQQWVAHNPAAYYYQHMAYFLGFLTEDLQPTTVYGGKRFRASLALLLGDAYEVKEAVLPAALSIELFHNFSLIHDDIVDHDEMRRGRPTVWKRFGTEHAINSGDGMLLAALQVVADEPGLLTDTQKSLVISWLLQKYQCVVCGQHLDFMLTDTALGDDSLTEATYLEMIEHKTADLIVAAVGVVGIVASVSETEQQALRTFAYHFGMAFQLHDDMESIWGAPSQTGKDAYGDIREGKKTLPVLRLYQLVDDESKTRLRHIFDPMATTEESDVLWVMEQLAAHHIQSTLQHDVQAHVQAAISACEALSVSGEQKHQLQQLVHDLVGV